MTNGPTEIRMTVQISNHCITYVNLYSQEFENLNTSTIRVDSHYTARSVPGQCTIQNCSMYPYGSVHIKHGTDLACLV